MFNTIEITGEVAKVLGYGQYVVLIEPEGHKPREIACRLSGRMRQNKIKVLPGDTVRLEIPPPYGQGRIVFRER